MKYARTQLARHELSVCAAFTMRGSGVLILPMLLAVFSAATASKADHVALEITSGIPFELYNPTCAGGPEVAGIPTAFIAEPTGLKQVDSQGTLIRTVPLPHLGEETSFVGLGYDSLSNRLFTTDDWMGTSWSYDLAAEEGAWEYEGQTGLINFSIRDVSVSNTHITVLDESIIDTNYYLKLFNKNSFSLEKEILLSGIVGSGDSFDGLGHDQENGRFYLSSHRPGSGRWSPHLYGIELVGDSMVVDEIVMSSSSVPVPDAIYGVGGGRNGLAFVGVRDATWSLYFGTIVPEPSSLLMLATGVAFATKRRRRSA